MARTKKTINPHCRWIEDEDGVWNTDCANKFVFIEAGPNENHMFFCCYCGRTLRAKADDDMSTSATPRTPEERTP